MARDIFCMVAGTGFEPATSGLWARRATELLHPASVPKKDTCLGPKAQLEAGDMGHVDPHTQTGRRWKCQDLASLHDTSEPFLFRPLRSPSLFIVGSGQA